MVSHVCYFCRVPERLLNLLYLMKFSCLTMQFQGLIGIFNVSSCSSSQLRFAHTVDLFQNMLKGKHLDSQLLEFCFCSLDGNQNKTNEKKEKKMVSQRPHGTIEYTVSTGVWCVHACFLKVELLKLRGRQWHKTESTNTFSVCTFLNRDCPY